MFEPKFEGHIQRCYFCHNEWGSCTCDFPNCAVDDPSAPGFDWCGFWITQPNTTECTRFFVNPVIYYGEAFVNSELARVPRSR